MKVTILSGIPGSGKSTFASGTGAGAIVCSADDWFCRSGEYRFNVCELGDAHGECLKKFVEAIQQGRDTVVDNTNTTSEEIVPYYAVAAAYGAQIELITVLCDHKKAAARNVHGVSAKGVEAMARRLAERKLPDFWQYNEKFSQRIIEN
jgi:predicted kinase